MEMYHTTLRRWAKYINRFIEKNIQSNYLQCFSIDATFQTAVIENMR